jgi:predicted dehydrogenase
LDTRRDVAPALAHVSALTEPCRGKKLARTYRIAILGLGHWYSGYALARALQEHPRAELVAVSHDHQDRTRQFADTFRIGAYADYRQLLERESVDIVHIAPPVADMHSHVMAAARAGKHIVLGKPMAMSVGEADEMVAAIRAAGITCVPFQGMHRIRYSPLKQELDEGLVGDLRLLQVSLHQAIAEDWFRSGNPGWFADPQRTPGGAFIDEGIYAIDRLMWLASAPVVEVQARVANLVHQRIAVEDWGMATMSFANGVLATLEASWTLTVPQPTAPAPKHNAVVRRVIVGTLGELIDDRPFLLGEARLTCKDPQWTVRRRAAELYGPLQPAALNYLIDCLESDQEPVANVQAARDALAVALACYESARTARPVQLQDRVP